MKYLHHHAIAIILPAAGQGSRMGQPQNKLFLNLNDQPLITHLAKRLHQFKQSLQADPLYGYDDLIVIAVTRPDEVSTFTALLVDYPDLVTAYVPGGPTRQASVLNGLTHLTEIAAPSTPTLIHDAARCLIPIDRLRLCASTVIQGTACGLALSATDTVRTMTSTQYFEQTLDRDYIAMMQTPQAATLEQLHSAHRQAVEAQTQVTDDVSVLIDAGIPVKMLPGTPLNLKLTHPDDIPFAEALLAQHPQKGQTP